MPRPVASEQLGNVVPGRGDLGVASRTGEAPAPLDQVARRAGEREIFETVARILRIDVIDMGAVEEIFGGICQRLVAILAPAACAAPDFERRTAPAQRFELMI